jgi:NAD(P)-dependent dehydrogenase (short-subunit alcohol dehydrogenase family)
VTPPATSYVVTGGGRGIGRAIAARLVREIAAVVVIDVAEPEPQAGVVAVVGDAADESVARRAAELAEQQAPLVGWVNNAAVFDDVDLAADPAGVLRVVQVNLAPAVVGCAVAVRHLTERGRSGAIVNVSSHQAQRAVRGALPYATAKAAVEGLTRALAVDAGPRGVRVNAVALGSITTERYEHYLDALDSEGRASAEAQMAALHPLGRVGRPDEVADVVAWLLGPTSGYVSGAVLPVDGGRAAQGRDPEEG